MYLEKSDFNSKSSIQFVSNMRELGLSCRRLIEETDVLRQRLDGETSLAKLYELSNEMMHFVLSNPVLSLHVQDEVVQLSDSLTALTSGHGDLLDLKISKAQLVNKLAACSQIFEIEQELIDTLWAVEH